MHKRVDAIISENLTALMGASTDYSTQGAIAKKCGVSQTTVGRILRMEVSATVANLDAIAGVFRLRATDLLDPALLDRLKGNVAVRGDEDAEASGSRAGFLESLDLPDREWLEMFQQLAPEHRKLALVALKAARATWEPPPVTHKVLGRPSGLSPGLKNQAGGRDAVHRKK